jgi:uncharacterized membrane protein YeaQ/YmgE (transglycosylase-associated protein family)
MMREEMRARVSAAIHSLFRVSAQQGFAAADVCVSWIRMSPSFHLPWESSMNLSLMGVIGWCVFGLIVGAIARFLMPGRQQMSMLVTMALGIVGSFAGGFISTLLFGGSDSLVNPAGWIMSVVGALIVLFAYGKFAKAKT